MLKKPVKKSNRFAIIKMYHPFLKNTAFMVYRQFLEDGEVFNYRLETGGDTLFEAVKIVFELERRGEDFGDYVKEPHTVYMHDNEVMGRFRDGNEAIELILTMET